jgi:hypothetical protein
MFGYEIEDCEITITGIKDRSTTLIEIPEFIEGYPVTKIDVGCFGDYMGTNIINNVKVENNFCVIRNKWIYYYGAIYKIIHQIGDDYYCDFTDFFGMYVYRNLYFIDNLRYCKNFKS